jgi:hypothetical protein
MASGRGLGEERMERQGKAEYKSKEWTVFSTDLKIHENVMRKGWRLITVRCRILCKDRMKVDYMRAEVQNRKLGEGGRREEVVRIP